jgi:hypothetical protein
MIFDTIPNDPPAGWQFETPKYRVTSDIRPAEKARYRAEPPFAQMSASDIWQYGTRPLKTGEIIETREWPHASFSPLNYAAKKTLEFFNLQMKSRLPRSPWYGDRLRLDNGLTGDVVTADDATTPKVPRVGLAS